MWYTLEEKQPEEGKRYPIWCVANHNGMEFHDYALWYGNDWWITGHALSRMGWTFIAWFDLPPYR
jgi:hypothetical protein